MFALMEADIPQSEDGSGNFAPFSVRMLLQVRSLIIYSSRYRVAMGKLGNGQLQVSSLSNIDA
jgi:hypothetical protein